jgi:uncharacterized protein (DUF1697 family)
MQTCIAILRGINVSGQRVIKMEALRQMCEEMGLSDVRTYIQSGNIIFNCKTIKGLEDRIASQILKSFGHEVPVIIKSTNEWEDILKSNPFVKDKSKDTNFLHVTILSGKPEISGLQKLSVNSDNDEFVLKSGAVYLYTPGGYGNTKLNNTFFESKLKCKATTRNWKTMNELLKMANEKN